MALSTANRSSSKEAENNDRVGSCGPSTGHTGACSDGNRPRDGNVPYGLFQRERSSSAAGPPTVANDRTVVPAPKPVVPPPTASSFPKAADETKPVAASRSNDVTVKLVDADEFKKVIAAQKGKVVLVDFWATYCGPCRDKFPQTLALGSKYASQGLTLVSVSMDSPSPRDQQKVLQFLTQQHARIINLANRLDDTETAFGAFDIDGGGFAPLQSF